MLRTSRIEKQDLLKAWIAISIAFGIVIRPAGVAFFSKELLIYIGISALTVGVGFLLHELAHKVIAQYYHCWAEFRANNTMLFLALVMSLAGFVFAAPGAVIIQGRVTQKQYGIISAAGPLTNIILAILFFPLLLLGYGFIGKIGTYGFMINTWLALFNMIPFGMLDGKKILKWSKPVYFLILGISILFMFLIYA